MGLLGTGDAMGARWRYAPAVLLLTLTAGCGGGTQATMTTPKTTEAWGAPDVHPVIEAYRSTLHGWMYEDERRRIDAVDARGTLRADPVRLRAAAVDWLVHRMLPLALESRGGEELSRRATSLRDTPSIESDGGDVVAAREIDVSLQTLRASSGAPPAEPDPQAVRAYADAYAEYAEVYARVMGVSAQEADAATASVTDVVEVALLAGRLVTRHGADRGPMVREAVELLREMTRLARVPGTDAATLGASRDARHASTHRPRPSPVRVR